MDAGKIVLLIYAVKDSEWQQKLMPFFCLYNLVTLYWYYWLRICLL
jgi:hypothetical protein